MQLLLFMAMNCN